MKKYNWKRNTSGLKAAAQQKAQATIERAREAIAILQQHGKPINFASVAKAGQVSVAWLYRNQTLRALIEKHRLTTQDAAPPAGKPKGGATTKGKDAIIAHLKTRIKILEQEKQDLLQALERAYGKACESGINPCESEINRE